MMMGKDQAEDREDVGRQRPENLKWNWSGLGTGIIR